MSKRKFLFTLAVITVMFAGTHAVTAQTTEDGLSLGPSARPYDANESSFTETDYFYYDAQLWAPWQITSIDGSQRFHYGFYAELGFAYYSIDRPGAIPGQDPREFNTGSNYHWAREIEIGWYSTKNAGWAANYLDLEGTTYVFGENIIVPNPMLLRTKIDQVEVNRQFRQRLSTGGWIEPYFGARYLSLSDKTNEDGSLTAVTGYRFNQTVQNSALGGHIGTRYFRQYNRWQGSLDGAVGVLYNTQNYFANTWIQNTVTTAVINTEATNAGYDVMPLLDLGAELTYALTRDISLRGGIGIQYIWQGIARADIRTAFLNPNATFSGLPAPSTVYSEDFIAAGFSFGIDWKR